MSVEKTSSNTRLGNITVSATAMSLDKLLEIYRTVAELEQQTYELQQKSVMIMALMAEKSADYTHEALKDAAASMTCNAAGTITGGAVGLTAQAGGLYQFSQRTTELKSVKNQLDTVETNRTNLAEALNKPQGIAIGDQPAVKPLDSKAVREDVRSRLAKPGQIEVDRSSMKDFVAADRPDAEKAHGELNEKYSQTANKLDRTERKREFEMQQISSFGQTLGGLGNGIAQTVGADKKKDEAENEGLKTVAQTAQQITRDMSERQGQGISSFDSIRQAISQAQGEMSASNRV